MFAGVLATPMHYLFIYLFIYLFMYLFLTFSQLAITCSKLTIEKLEQGVKYVQS